MATAEAAFRRAQWAPTSLSQLLRLAADRRSVVVNNLPDLAAATLAALQEIQIQLTGATPDSHYLWDIHARRPKSEDEISDYLCNELDRVLASRGAVVNREVQIRRNGSSGIGERPDALVDASLAGRPQNGRLSLPIEVKGAWNGELLTAASTQLVDRYMRDLGAAHGIYVVAWPDLDSWTDGTDNRRTTLASLNRAASEARLARQASDLDQRGSTVHVVHLDIAYRRPAAEPEALQADT